jgi:phosphatidate cytidylyltransferase
MAQPPRSEPPAESSEAKSRIGNDLWPRVLSGVVMVAVTAGLTVAGLWPFAGLLLAVSGFVAWEWGRIVRGVQSDVVMVVHLGVVTVAVALVAMQLPGLALLALLIGAILVTLLCIGRSPGLSALGVGFAGLPAVALIWLRADEPYGLWAVLFVMAMVVVTDTAAYFSGRLIGGPKLWPRVSPSKTWAGLGGAVVGSALAAAAFASLVPKANPLHLALLGAVIAVVAQAGDFAESALKRKFGTKDASQIIPGHGGFMDRVDGLVTAAIFAALFAAVVNIHAPAQALLTW